MITISYSFTDYLDLTPDPYRSLGYNVCSVFTGVPYHYLLGGNAGMEVHAEWKTTIPPEEIW
jgi:hypothetical protein